MAQYFLLLDNTTFESEVRPALAECWRQRSFAPCQALCAALVPAAQSYARAYHVGTGESLPALVAAGMSFDRATWRALVGEVLLYSAREIPELQTCPESLCCLLAPDHYRRELSRRDELSPIQQAHAGSRDLTFGAAVYRPEDAGYNHANDVARLADYLASVRPDLWTAADLFPLRDIDPADREEELAFARDWFPELAQMFRCAQEGGQVIVHECI